MPQVTEVRVPFASRLRHTLKVIHFCDAYRVALSKPGTSVQDAYEAVFGNAPSWVRGLMAVRGLLASAAGLKHVAAHSPLTSGEAHFSYQVGQRVGLFTVQAIEPNELIVGDDDRHLNFRISILRSTIDGAETVTISTAVQIHNMLGRVYMVAIKPFHRIIAKSMLQRAADSGRL